MILRTDPADQGDWSVVTVARTTWPPAWPVPTAFAPPSNAS
jgi:hypothetical protein